MNEPGQVVKIEMPCNPGSVNQYIRTQESLNTVQIEVWDYTMSPFHLKLPKETVMGCLAQFCYYNHCSLQTMKFLLWESFQEQTVI